MNSSLVPLRSFKLKKWNFKTNNFISGVNLASCFSNLVKDFSLIKVFLVVKIKNLNEYIKTCNDS